MERSAGSAVDVQLCAGIVSLQRLHEFARRHATGGPLNGRSVVGREYGRLAGEITREIADEHGFYLWGAYDRRGFWQNLYLGKAGYGATAHLRARLVEELRDERAFLWYSLLTPSEINALGRQFYPRMWTSYSRGEERKRRKAGATHIVWVAAPALDNRQVLDVEADLIETLNPSANLRRPVPPHIFQPWTVRVVEAIRRLVHGHRGNRYEVGS
jgi:hypothetical protein